VNAIFLRVALDTPLDTFFDYRWVSATEEANASNQPCIGQLVLVPFGRQEITGLIVDIVETTTVPADKLRDVIAVRHVLPALNAEWLALIRFAADYYQRPLGEVALPALPKNLKVAKTVSLDRALKKLGKLSFLHDATPQAEPALNARERKNRSVLAVCCQNSC